MIASCCAFYCVCTVCVVVCVRCLLAYYYFMLLLPIFSLARLFYSAYYYLIMIARKMQLRSLIQFLFSFTFELLFVQVVLGYFKKLLTWLLRNPQPMRVLRFIRLLRLLDFIRTSRKLSFFALFTLFKKNSNNYWTHQNRLHIRRYMPVVQYSFNSTVKYSREQYYRFHTARPTTKQKINNKDQQQYQQKNNNY